jgi:hypothetical protein
LRVLAGGLAGRRLPVVLMSAFDALGSSRGAIAALMLRQAGIWAAVGPALGAAGVVVIARMVQGLLHGVSAFDGGTAAVERR